MNTISGRLYGQARPASATGQGRTGQGHIKQLKGRLAGKLRLRSGDFRLIISQSADTLRVHSVHHRKEAYR